jgi:hypothetical protein
VPSADLFAQRADVTFLGTADQQFAVLERDGTARALARSDNQFRDHEATLRASVGQRKRLETNEKTSPEEL